MLKGMTARHAARARDELLVEALAGDVVRRQKIGEYAQSWIKLRLPGLDRSTSERYAEALDNHLLPAFGELFVDALRADDIQRWVNGSLADGYAVATVRGWLRVLKVMMRDNRLFSRECLESRITFPQKRRDEDEDDEPNSLTREELSKFLDAMSELYPQHYALVATLAFTGLRFSHASALKWDDIDEDAGIIRVRRKQVRGTVGPVSKHKRAPRQYPLPDALATILRAHRRRLMANQEPGFASGWCFPSKNGELRFPSSLKKAFTACKKAAKINKRFTPHGLRRTFTTWRVWPGLIRSRPRR